MKKITNVLAAAFAFALLAGALAGCGGGAATSSSAAASESASATESASAAASSSAASQSADELQAELQDILDAQDYNRPFAMSGSIDTTIEGSTADASGTVDITFNAEMDLSQAETQLHEKFSMSESGADEAEVEMWIDGDDVILSSDGQVIGSTLSALGMSEMSTPEDLLESLGGSVNVDLSSLKEITKASDGDDTVYSVTFDPESYGADLDMDATVSSVQVDYRVNKDGDLISTIMLMRADVTEDGETFPMSMRADVQYYGFGTAKIPEAPTPTMTL